MLAAAEHVKCDRDIYKETVEKWGIHSQLLMATEELGELLVALAHYQRGRCDKDTVAEEIADVMLMAEEMAYLFGRERVIFWLEKKKEVIQRRLTEDSFRPAKEIMEDQHDTKNVERAKN